MISRDLFIPSFSAVLVAGMVAFLSCSQQIRYEESEEYLSSMAPDEESEPQQQQVAESKSTPSQQEPIVETSKNSDDSGFVIQLEDSNSKVDVVDNADLMPKSEPTIESPTISAEPIISKPPMRVMAQLPAIPKTAIKRKDGLLNRFYFVRAGDTPDSVSTLIYGAPDKVNQLRVNRGMKWAPGRLVYYNSPKNPSDMTMVSFYREGMVEGINVKIKRGDWLSKIAKKYLGSPKSWVEIAVMNQIENPLDLTVGQKLTVFPVIEPQKTPPPRVAVNESPIINTPSPAEMTPQPQPQLMASPPPASEEQPRRPLTIEETPTHKKLTVKEYFSILIEKLNQMMGRKY